MNSSSLYPTEPDYVANLLRLLRKKSREEVVSFLMVTAAEAHHVGRLTPYRKARVRRLVKRTFAARKPPEL